MKNQKITISVIGGHKADKEVEYLAHDIGKYIAEVGAILVCGGLGGVMEAACAGCKGAGGLVIGILPGPKKEDANPYVDIALPTSMGFSRNVIVACSADIVVALKGSHGTNTEICYALVYKKPVIDLGQWNIDGMVPARDLSEAQRLIKEMIAKIKSAT